VSSISAIYKYSCLQTINAIDKTVTWGRPTGGILDCRRNIYITNMIRESSRESRATVLEHSVSTEGQALRNGCPLIVWGEFVLNTGGKWISAS
jgi:hypothetical protein